MRKSNAVLFFLTVVITLYPFQYARLLRSYVVALSKVHVILAFKNDNSLLYAADIMPNQEIAS